MDATPDEIETLAELRLWLDKRSLAGLAVQGLDLTGIDLSGVAVDDALFLGCRLSTEVAADLVGRGASVVPELAHAPYPTHPSTLYTPADLTAGFERGGFAGMYDTAVYEHFVEHGGPLPPIREALSQRLHDHGIDNALTDALGAWKSAPDAGPVVGVMGGHAEPRGSVAYREAAALGHALTRAGALVLTGGGPGVMEAANLGAYLPDAALPSALEELTAAPYFADHEPYTAAALAVRSRYPSAEPWAGGLSIPTWLYGHEPANLFAGQIAKYFSNAIREDTILRAARGGIVFAPGKAGTVQEVFQAATKAFYNSDGASGPMIFLDRRYWTEVLPVEALLRPLFAQAPTEPARVHLTDDVDEAVALLTGG
ncbi:LOG family protein [Cryptosporangium minutisporangium]|uniref:LOG family protein n=1 Tax=Cryptosporangium minutisporangium TaxID=113569 RepID=A0ABP6T7G7_9ACTN